MGWGPGFRGGIGSRREEDANARDHIFDDHGGPAQLAPLNPKS